ncbi:MAG: MFS transporter [Candidatus Promineifilaceae bacterium]
MNNIANLDSIRRRVASSIFIAQSLFSASVIVAFTLTSIIAVDLSGLESRAGWPSTMSLIGRALLAYPLGWLMDRIGRRLGISLGFLVGTIGVLISAASIIAGSFFGFLFGALLLGGSRAVIEQGRYVAAEVFPLSRQAKIIGTIVFAGTIGAIGGPLLVDPSGSVSEKIFGVSAHTGPFFVATILLVLGGIIIFVFLRPDPLTISRQMAADQRQADAAAGKQEIMARPLREIFSHGMPLLAVASMMVGQLVMTLLMVITPLHMSHHDHTTKAISWVIMAHTLGMFGLSGLTGWLIDRFGRIPMIIVGTMILAAACLLAPISVEVPLLALSLFLLGLGWNFCFVAGSSLLSAELTANERGRAQGVSEAAVALGAGAGSLGTGYIFSQGEMLAVAVVGLVITFILFGLAIGSQIPRRSAVKVGTGD